METPAKSKNDKLPVFVMIHGVGFLVAAGVEAGASVVVVSVVGIVS